MVKCFSSFLLLPHCRFADGSASKAILKINQYLTITMYAKFVDCF